MIPFLDQQPSLNYRIYVVNQTDELPFNRAKLLNVGFVESMVDFNWTCLIFHDIDLLPLNTTNNYTCSDRPLHMSARINIFDYKVPYAGIFGGVSALTPQHFTLVNGFSNLFWGWGGEDDDMAKRLARKPCIGLCHRERKRMAEERKLALKMLEKEGDYDSGEIHF